MQVKIIVIEKRENLFPSDSVIFAIKKIREKFDVVSVEKSKNTDLLKAINSLDFTYFVLTDDITYSKTLKSVSEKSDYNVNVLMLGKNFDKQLENVVCSVDGTETYKLFGVPKSDVENYFTALNIDCKIKSRDGDTSVSLDFSNNSERFIDSSRKAFLTEFDEYIYSTRDISLEKLLVEILAVRRMKISVAESFTGGNLSAALTSVSGSSKVFYEGQVTYDSDAKNKRLGVKKLTLSEYKPVSKQVAYEMCYGLLKTGKCDIALSTTGIAGPTSDDSDFPVGLCYIGVGTVEKITVYKYNFKGSRLDITSQGVNTALYLAIKNLK